MWKKWQEYLFWVMDRLDFAEIFTAKVFQAQLAAIAGKMIES